MKKQQEKNLLLYIKLAGMKPPAIPDGTFVVQVGESIQAVIDRCLESGGGRVIVPEGTWETGPLHLGSNLELYLAEGAVLSFSDRPEDYLPVVFTRWEGMECYNYSPLIYARDAVNLAITGSGTLLGNGQAWWPWKQLQQAAADELCYAQLNGVPVEKRVYGTREAALRPSFIQTVSCKNVLIEGISIEDGPQWTIHPVYCENVIVHGVKVHTQGPNTDGLNPDSCRNVLIEYCEFDTGDDCIAINAGMNEDGWRVDRPCENVLIRDCVMRGGHGGVVIGSAVSGGVRNILAEKCVISGTSWGIRIKSMRGRGGYVKHASFRDFTIHDTSKEAVQITQFYEYSTVVPKSDKPSQFSDITLQNINGSANPAGVLLRGLPELPMKDVTLSHIDLKGKAYAISCEDVKNLRLDRVK